MTTFAEGVPIPAFMGGREIPNEPDIDEWQPPDEPPADEPEPEPQPAAPEVDDEDTLRLTICLAGASRLVPGGTFILDAPEHVESLWGRDNQVLWAAGEPLMINGPTGVGKTTIAQQVVLARLGIRPNALGMAVAETSSRVLYIAADRPRQAARSFRRMVSEDDRGTLDKRLEVWRGPLPVQLSKNPEILLAMADTYGADTIVVDSLKDVVAKLSDDEAANLANNAFQACSANNVELMVLHHQRKAQADNKKPSSISDVFGSTWLTAGMGSVVLVWGQPGDLVVEVSHLKQPAEQLTPLTAIHDHDHGITTAEEGVDIYKVIRSSNGLTAEAVAKLLFKLDDPKKNDVEKARRQIQKLIDKGLVCSEDGGKSAVSGKQLPNRYFATERREAP